MLWKLAIGVFVLLLGIPTGMLLAKFTNDELKYGKVWFKMIVVASLTGAVFNLFYGNDYLLFSLLFIAIVTSMCLKVRK